MALTHVIASAFCGFARLLTGVRALWLGCQPDARPRVYYANHRSHGDFLVIWASLPPALRERTRPVAGADYWLRGNLRRYLIEQIFRGVLIDRQAGRSADQIGIMGQPLTAGESLILFPEGTRNLDDGLLPFKSGLYYLAQAHPEVELIPVWIENLGRTMPKGSVIPIPLLCTLRFGAPLVLREGESRDEFLQRCRDALVSLALPAE
jgi:1-acyl-sn-glycerol-3-phosphate acyltransferase